MVVVVPGSGVTSLISISRVGSAEAISNNQRIEHVEFNDVHELTVPAILITAAPISISPLCISCELRSNVS